MTLRLIGCSFTNWIYPTWADFCKLHYDYDIKIYGRPGLGNDAFKRLFLTKVKKNDHVILMWSGNDRLDHGIDIKYNQDRMPHYLKNSLWSNSFAFRDQMFVPLNTDGIDHKKHFSLFHALYKQAEVIVDVQNHALSNDVECNFLSWQDLFSDLSHRRERAGLGKPIDLEKYLKNPLFDTVYKIIDKSKFLDDPRHGLLNYLHKDKALFMYQNAWDFHPSAYAHFKYFVEYIKPRLDKSYKNMNNIEAIEKAVMEFSDYYKDTDCKDAPFNAKGDNEFTHEKFFNLRSHIIENFFKQFAQQLTEGHHYE